MKAVDGVAGAGVALEDALTNIVADGIVALLGIGVRTIFLIADVWRTVRAD